LRTELTSVSVWLSIAALATAQSRATPAELVEQLAVAESRANARTQLLALGKEAVPALANRVTATEPGLQAEVLAILIELGPDAGAAVPQLIAAVERNGPRDPTPVLQALAELGPFRAPDVDIDLNNLSHTLLTRGFRRQGLDTEVDGYRLRRRLDFPRTLDVEALLVIAQGCQAYRVELAVEHLGLHGPAAAAALPVLQRLLERPEPRILMTDRTVPMHRKAARAVLAIAPVSPQAELARAVLAGKAPPPVAAPAVPAVPERARVRIAELVAELDVAAKRGGAAANLVALGALAAPAVAATLAQEHDVDSRQAALAVLRDLGPRAASTVPELLEALTSLSTDHTVSVLRTLQATAPWCTDVVPGFTDSCSLRHLDINGRRVQGKVDGAFLTAFFAARAQYWAALSVDPTSPPAELDALLDSLDVAKREAALAVVRERGSACRTLLPTLARMLTADPPKGNFVEWLDSGGVRTGPITRTAVVQHLAAQAIVAIAPSDDPLVAAARDVLARGEPK
jgi:hypothetical protein